ncbi:hypothetical protein C8F01DRAFT_1325967 [Mycena amicta]|nr:hypothetical protein C8F01DRAFT_1325967 [Mycena amicta]
MSLPTFGFSTTCDEVADALASEISGKNVLITGTSLNGIGFDTARSIAKYAALVVITGYNAERLQLSAEAIRKEVPTANIRTLGLDLSSLAAVRKAAAEVNAYPEPLHVLIHNAAYTSGAYSITADDIEGQMAIDHVSPFLLSKLLLPKLLASKSASPTWLPRIVLVSSEVHAMGPGLDFSGLRKPPAGSAQETQIFLRYHEAKAANVLTALELAKRGEGKLRAYSLHPGVIFTNIHNKDAVVSDICQFSGTLKEGGQPNLETNKWKTIPQGAATTVVAAFDPRLNVSRHLTVSCSKSFPLELWDGLLLFIEDLLELAKVSIVLNELCIRCYASREGLTLPELLRGHVTLLPSALRAPAIYAPFRTLSTETLVLYLTLAGSHIQRPLGNLYQSKVEEPKVEEHTLWCTTTTCHDGQLACVPVIKTLYTVHLSLEDRDGSLLVYNALKMRHFKIASMRDIHPPVTGRPLFNVVLRQAELPSLRQVYIHNLPDPAALRQFLVNHPHITLISYCGKQLSPSPAVSPPLIHPGLTEIHTLEPSSTDWFPGFTFPPMFKPSNSLSSPRHYLRRTPKLSWTIYAIWRVVRVLCPALNWTSYSGKTNSASTFPGSTINTAHGHSLRRHSRYLHRCIAYEASG